MLENTKRIFQSQGSKKLIWAVGILVLFLYPLRHTFVGLDLWDAGYNYGNFRYMDTSRVDSMWLFSTWLSNGLGALFTRLPFGNMMAGMNVYTGLILSSCAVASFLFCVKRLGIPTWIAFIGEMLALSLCWLPSAVLYNYLTYALLLLGTMLLYQGLVKNQKRYLIAAGAVLGINVGVRISNLVQVGLILAVWGYGIIGRKKSSQVWKETGWCVVGYLGGFLIFLVPILSIYGVNAYTEGISRLFMIPAHASDYSAGAMLEGMVWAYFHSAYWLKRFLLAAGVGVLLCLALPRRWRRVKQAFSVLLFVPAIWWLRENGFYSSDTTTYNAIFYPSVIFLTMVIGLGGFQILRRKADKEEKLLAGLLILTVLVASLGGNNAIYSSINNLFLVLPCAFWMIWKFCRDQKEVVWFPVKCMLLLAVFFVLVQGARFGVGFVYEEATGGRNMNTQIEDIPVLKGIHTNGEEARWVQEVYAYLLEAQLLDREVFLYGQIPGMAYYMGVDPAMNTWSDLRSYSYGTMSEDMEKLKKKMITEEYRPFLLLEAAHAQYILDGDGSKLFWEENAERKMQLISDFIEENNYQRTFSNEKFVIYE